MTPNPHRDREYLTHHRPTAPTNNVVSLQSARRTRPPQPPTLDDVLPVRLAATEQHGAVLHLREVREATILRFPPPTRRP